MLQKLEWPSIVILDGAAENPGDLSWEGFAALGKLQVFAKTEKEEILSRIGQAEIVITNKTPITEETLKACPGIRYIGVLATGYNVVDVEAAKLRGIPVCNIPSYGTQAVAQFVFALLLEICHRIGHHNEAVQAGQWGKNGDFCFWDYPLIELSGKTLGILGYGRIGKAVAQIAMAFGLRVLVCGRPGSTVSLVAVESENKGVEIVEFSRLLAESDILSLHCPLTKETREIISADSLAQMKNGAILINTSRGPLIREADLADALRSGKLYAAGLDVTAVEPIPKESPLLGLDNCLITPHIAWAPKESRQRLMDTAVENLKKFLQGDLQNVVNA